MDDSVEHMIRVLVSGRGELRGMVRRLGLANGSGADHLACWRAHDRFFLD